MSKVTDMKDMFSESEFNGDISNWDDAILQNEDYTLGMILQYLMHVNYYEGANTMTFLWLQEVASSRLLYYVKSWI